MANVLEDNLGNEREAYFQYLKQLKAETVNRFFLRYTELDVRFFQDNLPIEDFKFWSGLAKKKFMGLNFVSMF